MTRFDRALIFETSSAEPSRDRFVRHGPTGKTTIVAVSDAAQIEPVATALVDEGALLIELCGGISPVWRSRTKKAVGGRAKVSSVTFGIESLAAAARFNTAFNEGKETKLAFLLLEPGANPRGDRSILTPNSTPTPLISVPDEDVAVKLAVDLAADDVLLIELFGGFTTEAVEKIIEAVDGRSAVGVGSFAVDEVEIEI